MSSGRVVDINDLEYRKKKVIAAEAYRKGHWIFNSREQLWYTPEEFMANQRRLGLDIDNCKVSDPRLGLRRMRGMVELRLKELEMMIIKIEDYFSFVPRRDKKIDRP